MVTLGNGGAWACVPTLARPPHQSCHTRGGGSVQGTRNGAKGAAGTRGGGALGLAQPSRVGGHGPQGVPGSCPTEATARAMGATSCSGHAGARTTTGAAPGLRPRGQRSNVMPPRAGAPRRGGQERARGQAARGRGGRARLTADLQRTSLDDLHGMKSGGKCLILAAREGAAPVASSGVASPPDS